MEHVKLFSKKLLILLLLLVSYTSVNAELLKFKTTAFAENTYNYSTRSWSGWSDWRDSNMLLTIDTDRSTIVVYSPAIQIYKIYEAEDSYYDSDGDLHVPFKFVDQDYDRGVVKLLQRKSGSSEVYIEFANIRWCYRVVRI